MADKTKRQLDAEIAHALANPISDHPGHVGQGRISPPARVEILKVTFGGRWKSGQYGYAHSFTARGGVSPTDRIGDTGPGEIAFLVSKSKDGRGGGSWFTRSGLRFTGGAVVPGDVASGLRRLVGSAKGR